MGLFRLSEAAVSPTYLLPFVEAVIRSGGDITLGLWEWVGRGEGGGGGEGGGSGVHHVEVHGVQDFCFQSQYLRLKRVSIRG